MEKNTERIWNCKKLIEDIKELLEIGKTTDEILFSLGLKSDQQLKEI